MHPRAWVLAALRVLALAIVVAAATECGGRTEDAGASASPLTYCAKRCVTSADCCPDGVPGCPGPYPLDFACDRGLCLAPRCAHDADCTVPFAKPACRAVGGLTACVARCDADADCASSGGGLGGLGAGACVGSADDGTPICGRALPGCASDAECLAGAHCVGGRCGCRDDADCTQGTLRHCHQGVCGCAADAECGPRLDACTTDRAYAYPASAAAAPGKP